MPIPFQIALGLLGALGIGSLIGSIAQAVFAGREASKQRAHDVEMRKLEHTLELEKIRVDNQQRLRDERLARIREAFAVIVGSLLELEVVMDAMEQAPLSDAQPGIPSADQQLPAWKAALLAANRETARVRPALLLDSDGERAVWAYADLSRRLSNHLGLMREQVRLGDHAWPELPGMLEHSRETISKGI
ncbi:MAG TPA: hypothetical protein VNF91_11105, partial [Candidatus Acidoferrum sp.]|nr:hypothetical protein [Candidatus Acidoferrum sp.]